MIDRFIEITDKDLDTIREMEGSLADRSNCVAIRIRSMPLHVSVAETATRR